MCCFSCIRDGYGPDNVYIVWALDCRLERMKLFVTAPLTDLFWMVLEFALIVL